MEAGGKDCEEETLQTAFKKLRVDAESLPRVLSVSDAPRAASRAGLDASGAKPKLGCTKDNWHGCMRKTSRGASRSQRRRRSKSPILHPPKFTYCSSGAAAALAAPGGGLKHQRLAVAAPEPTEPRPDGRTASPVAVPAQTELSSSGAAGHISPLVFGSRAGYEVPPLEAPPPATPAAATPGREGGDGEDGGPEKSACEGAELGAGALRICVPADAADFRALSELHSGASSSDSPRASCSCAWTKSSAPPEERRPGPPPPPCRCRPEPQGWAGVEVYSFTGLRDVISECERGLPSPADAPRTPGAGGNAAAAAAASSSSASRLSSGSPRSCSEQARAYVDDITIEDLSGYMEYYLYIPKKMSHMAEMMYT